MKAQKKKAVSEEEDFVVHACTQYSEQTWKAVEFSPRKGKLRLNVEVQNDCHVDKFEIDVQYCPFCGYRPKEQ